MNIIHGQSNDIDSGGASTIKQRVSSALVMPNASADETTCPSTMVATSMPSGRLKIQLKTTEPVSQ